MFHQKRLQFVDQVERENFLWSIEAPCKTGNFDQKISLEADGDD